MSALTAEDQTQADSIEPTKMLHTLFERFERQSSELQQRYEALTQEVAELQAKLNDKEDKLKRSEKLALLGQTAAAIAHEVRNPLGALKLFTTLLRDEIKGQSSAEEIIQHMLQSISAVEHVVSNILHFSKTPCVNTAGSKPTALNLHALIQEQALTIPLISQGKVAVTLALNAKPFVYGVEHALRQVLQNLVLNALQAMQYKGCIEIETHALSDASTSIIVRDSGPGIAPEVLDRVFEPFTTTKTEGTGLGLAIVRQIIEQHGGDISVKNRTQGTGAEFEIILKTKVTETSNETESNHR